MEPSATLFLDVCLQRDLGPGGAWPLIGPADASRIPALFAVAAARGIRQGGVVCRHCHAGSPPVASAPPHCLEPSAALDRLPGCVPHLPVRVWSPDEVAGRDRRHAVYVTSGCGQPPDGTGGEAAFRHLVAGVRDAVIFGAGVEHGIDAAVRALLRRRVRTHVVLDAVGAADPERAQQVVADWKRAGVDGITVGTIERLWRAA